MAHVGPTATSQMAFMPARFKNKRALQAPLTPQALKLTQGSGGADAVFGSRYRRKDGDQPIRLNSDHHLTSSIHHRG